MTSKAKVPSRASTRATQGVRERVGSELGAEDCAPPAHRDLVDESGKCLGTIPDREAADSGSLAPTVYLRRDLPNPRLQSGAFGSGPDGTD
jgi:hypothetical protein